jgi:hypothetical protein
MTNDLKNIKNLIDATVGIAGFYKNAETVEQVLKSYREIAFQCEEYERMTKGRMAGGSAPDNSERTMPAKSKTFDQRVDDVIAAIPYQQPDPATNGQPANEV